MKSGSGRALSNATKLITESIVRSAASAHGVELGSNQTVKWKWQQQQTKTRKIGSLAEVFIDVWSDYCFDSLLHHV